MIEAQPQGRFSAKCDQCSVDSGVLQAASEDAARSLLRASGWSFTDGGLAYCVRCGTVPSTPRSRKLKEK